MSRGRASRCRVRGAAACGRFVAVLCLVLAMAPARGEDRKSGLMMRLTDRAWAWVARDERSSNGALLVGDEAALVVDPGLTPALAREFLAAARQVTDRPVRWVVLTHWHPDHALGTICLEDLSAQVIAHPRTRRSLAEKAARVRDTMAARAPDRAERTALERCPLHLPARTIEKREVLELGGHPVEVFHPGAAHTAGDLVVWSASERVLVTGDLFLRDSCPSMGEGSVEVWQQALRDLAALKPLAVVPGHFAPGSVDDLLRFRSYLQAQWDAVRQALAGGLSPEAVVTQAVFPAFSTFRQFPQYGATFAGNARAILHEIQSAPAAAGQAGPFKVVATLRVGKAPHQIAFSADGSRAYIAAAGSNRITTVDATTRTVMGGFDVPGTPLGVAELPGGDLAVSAFRSDRVARFSAAGQRREPDLATGDGPSLLVPVSAGQFLVVAERAHRLWMVDGTHFALEEDYATGRRPFPPAVTRDGRKAFVPNYDDGTITVVDLWNRNVLATVPVGEHPSGGVVLPGDILYAVAVRGENRIALINTASHQVVGSIGAGIGEEPFSVVSAPDGRFAFVNNTASHDVSVMDLASRRVVARVPVGRIPIVMAVQPGGRTLWVSCEGSHQVDVIAIPPAARPAEEPQAPPEVAVLGMIHAGHRTSARWGLDQVRETIRRFAPDVVCAEIPPDRWERIWTDWTERGVIEDERVQLFPEYTDVLLPLAIQLGFQVEPCAAWTREMAELRRQRIHQHETDPALREAHEAYEKRLAEVKARHAQEPLDEEDPRVIHSALYDRRTREELEPYDEFLNDWIGPGGWTHINEAHLRRIDRVIQRHPGQRILITFGAGHKYRILEHLRRRSGIRLVDITGYLPEE